MTAADLYRAVLLDPADDLARLAYADALEEQGGADEVARAWLVRDMLANPYELGVAAHLSGPVVARRGLPPVAIADGLTCQRTYRRGLAAEVAVPLEEWLTHGPALVRAHPLQAVQVLGATPLRIAGTFRWYRNASSAWPPGAHLPPAVYDCLRGLGSSTRYYHSWAARRDALAALSYASIQWARAEAGLPPLP